MHGGLSHFERIHPQAMRPKGQVIRMPPLMLLYRSLSPKMNGLDVAFVQALRFGRCNQSVKLLPNSSSPESVGSRVVIRSFSGDLPFGKGFAAQSLENNLFNEALISVSSAGVLFER
jgi:hypothetical protein